MYVQFYGGKSYTFLNILSLDKIPNGTIFKTKYHLVSQKEVFELNSNLQSSFKALADPTRRNILRHLSTRDMTVKELTDQFDITRAAVKKHLTVLETGNLISSHRKGRDRINKLQPEALRSVQEWLSYFDQFWDERLSELKNAIDSEQGKNHV